MIKKTSPITYTVVWQMFIAGVPSIGLAFADTQSAYSFALGAGIFILSNLYFTIYAFRFSSTHRSDWVFLSLKRGEAGKIILTALSFALVFTFVQALSVDYLFLGFLALVSANFVLAVKISQSDVFKLSK